MCDRNIPQAYLPGCKICSISFFLFCWVIKIPDASFITTLSLRSRSCLTVVIRDHPGTACTAPRGYRRCLATTAWTPCKFVSPSCQTCLMGTKSVQWYLDMKGCIWHFVKWQIHLFLSKGTNYSNLCLCQQYYVLITQYSLLLNPYSAEIFLYRPWTPK